MSGALFPFTSLIDIPLIHSWPLVDGHSTLHLKPIHLVCPRDIRPEWRTADGWEICLKPSPWVLSSKSASLSTCIWAPPFMASGGLFLIHGGLSRYAGTDGCTSRRPSLWERRWMDGPWPEVCSIALGGRRVLGLWSLIPDSSLCGRPCDAWQSPRHGLVGVGLGGFKAGFGWAWATRARLGAVPMWRLLVAPR